MSRASTTVAVLISAGRHPVSGTARACRGEAVALALGRRLAGDRLRVAHAGHPQEPSLRDYLALGAGSIEVLPTAEGMIPVALLAGHLEDVDVILTGSRAEKGAGSGLLPYQLASAMSRPLVSNVLEAAIDQDEVKIRQFLPKGRRRVIAAPTPVILVVHPLAPAELNYAYVRRMTGQIDVVRTEPVAGVSNTMAWTVEPARRLIRLKARESKAGHDRLLAAIVTEAKGGVVAFEGSPVDKAQIMLTYLREHRLVDF